VLFIKHSDKPQIMTAQQIKQSIQGEWVSIAPEIRPSITKNAAVA